MVILTTKHNVLLTVIKSGEPFLKSGTFLLIVGGKDNTQ